MEQKAFDRMMESINFMAPAIASILVREYIIKEENRFPSISILPHKTKILPWEYIIEGAGIGVVTALRFDAPPLALEHMRELQNALKADPQLESIAFSSAKLVIANGITRALLTIFERDIFDGNVEPKQTLANAMEFIGQSKEMPELNDAADFYLQALMTITALLEQYLAEFEATRDVQRVLTQTKP
ncbi:hypothetical protein HY967_01355 [Candidatus Jorgensenbacteria bacterium]|nr:hypothetical protein [Candidatus Jorgensenbacteria bacterium]